MQEFGFGLNTASPGMSWLLGCGGLITKRVPANGVLAGTLLRRSKLHLHFDGSVLRRLSFCFVV